MYIEALRRLGATTPDAASRALVIEDAIHGLVAGRAAGAYVIGVTTSLPAESLVTHADEVAGDGLPGLVRRLATLAPAARGTAAGGSGSSSGGERQR